MLGLQALVGRGEQLQGNQRLSSGKSDMQLAEVEPLQILDESRRQAMGQLRADSAIEPVAREAKVACDGFGHPLKRGGQGICLLKLSMPASRERDDIDIECRAYMETPKSKGHTTHHNERVLEAFELDEITERSKEPGCGGWVECRHTGIIPAIIAVYRSNYRRT